MLAANISRTGVVVALTIALALVASATAAFLPASLQPWGWSLCLYAAAVYAAVIGPVCLDGSGFVRTRLARVLAAVCALALLGDGIAALLPQPTSIYVMSISIWVAVGIAVTAAIVSLDEHPREVLFGAIALPFVLFGYIVLTNELTRGAPTLGYGMIALGLMALGFAARPGPASRAVRLLHLPRRPAHAH